MAEEIELIQSAQKGDLDAFRTLVERYKKNVYYFAFDMTGNHQDAEDLSQEVFIKMFKSLKSFKMKSKLSYWLYRITLNTYLSQKRTGREILRKQQNSLEEIQNKFVDSCDTNEPGKAVEQAIMQAHVKTALQKLSPKERAVFVMRHYQDLKVNEIAQALKIASGSVKSMLFRSLIKLENYLQFYKKEYAKEINP